MAQFFTDFSKYTAGLAPDDWTRRWVASPGTWKVIANAGFGGTKNGLQGSGLTAVRNGFAWNTIDADAGRGDVEIVYRWSSDNGTGNADARVMVRGSGLAGAETGYRIGLANGFKWAEVMVGGTVTTPTGGKSAATTTIAAGAWYWGRVRLSGSNIKFRHWADGATEPTTWDLDLTDTGVTGVGWVGLFQGIVNGKTTFDMFGVGTGGAAAPTTAVNNAPVVSAGADQTVAAGSVVTIRSTESDPDRDAITGTWTQVSGPSVALANAANATTTFTASIGGRYVFRRTVSDGALTATSDTTVKVTTTTGVRPDADIDNSGAFTITGAATIYAALADEVDSSFAVSPDNPTSKSCTERLAPMAVPADLAGVKVSVRARSTNATSATMTVELLQGTTVRKAWPAQAITAAWADYAFALDATSAGAITDWTDLRVRVTTTAS